MKLIPLSEFVLEQKKENLSGVKIPHYRLYREIADYAKFLKQPLTLGMFIPVDWHGNVLKEPSAYHEFLYNEEYLFSDDVECIKYDEAKEKVLFEGFDQKGGLSVAKAICQTYQIIEDLTFKKVPLVDLTLTPSALQAIGLNK